jgi:8-oxo-dGTP diphosphatase
MSSQKRVHVAVAVIRKGSTDSTKILITKRSDDAHQGGLWEFPGGKVELNETVQEALQRELEEELGVVLEPQSLEPLIQIRHDYPDKHVLLDVWFVDRFKGEPYGKEGQPFEWVPVDTLHTFDFPAANIPIIRAVNLPRKYLITPEFESCDALAAYIEKAIGFGFSILQIRQPQLDDSTFLAWAHELLALFRQRQHCQLIWNRELSALQRLPSGCAWHLSSSALKALAADSSVVIPDLVGASCHNEKELALTESLGLSYALLSPILQTASHPGQTGIGFEAFQRLVANCSLPVYALGGLDQKSMAEALHSGAQGIAAISAWQAMMTS